MRGSKPILIFLSCFVAVFAMAQPINTVSNMAAAVKANAALPASGNGAGLTNVDALTRRQSTAYRWDFERDWTYRTNEIPWGVAADGFRPTFVSAADEYQTNNVWLTNGFLSLNHVPTNNQVMYWNRSAPRPVVAVDMAVRRGTNNGTTNAFQFSAYNPSFLILVHEIPLQTGVGLSGHVLHLTFANGGLAADYGTNGIAGIYNQETNSGRFGSWNTANGDGLPYWNTNQTWHSGFEMLNSRTMYVYHGPYYKYWTLDGFTNLFAPGTGRGTNVVFETFANNPDPFVFASKPEFQSFRYNMQQLNSLPVGLNPGLGRGGQQAGLELVATNISGGPARIGNVNSIFNYAGFTHTNDPLAEGVWIGPNGDMFEIIGAGQTLQWGNVGLGAIYGGIGASSFFANVNANFALNATSAVFTATSLIAGGGGIASATTNATLTMAAGGITNTTAIQYTIYGFTGTGVVLTNLSRPISIALGTITAPATIVLQPNDALMGTLCAAAGDRGF